MHGPALDDALEPAELGDVELGVGHLAGIVELDRDLAVALDPGDRIDDDPVRGQCRSISAEPGRARVGCLAVEQVDERSSR